MPKKKKPAMTKKQRQLLADVKKMELDLKKIKQDLGSPFPTQYSGCPPYWNCPPKRKGRR
jgi:hypothetical protein